MSVLVVDDHSDARMLVERMLEGSGAEILLAASAKRALDICKRQKIDILISDLGMPEMDGLEMIRQMRAREDGRSLMAIAVTAFAHLEDRQAALRQGFDFLATKPVDAGELMLLVGKCVSRLRRHIQN
ncbi:MAG: response regulator [Terrimicrobiaceae bacterium]